MTPGLNAATNTETHIEQVAQLSQGNRAARWVSCGWMVGDGWVRQYSAPNVVGAKKLKALIFYTTNPLLYDKRSLCVVEPLFGRLRATHAVHLRLIGNPVVDFLLAIIELFV